MGIREILNRGGDLKKEEKSEDGYYRRIIGLCTKRANDVLLGRTDVYLPGKYKTKARFVECSKCGLIDCLIRNSTAEQFPTGTRCPRCGGPQVGKLN